MEIYVIASKIIYLLRIRRWDVLRTKRGKVLWQVTRGLIPISWLRGKSWAGHFRVWCPEMNQQREQRWQKAYSRGQWDSKWRRVGEETSDARRTPTFRWRWAAPGSDSTEWEVAYKVEQDQIAKGGGERNDTCFLLNVFNRRLLLISKI
jgi:hypothetical protein